MSKNISHEEVWIRAYVASIAGNSSKTEYYHQGI